MKELSNPSRRHALLVAAGIAVSVGAETSAVQAAEAAEKQGTNSGILVAYFSRSGNTKVVAQHIRLATQGSIFEIVPRDPYPEDYEETVSQAGREDRSGFEPAIRDRVSSIGSYATIFLGFPIWGMSPPPIIRAFLSENDTADKTLVPFITHGGYGIGDSLSALKAKAPKARIRDPFVLKADQEKQTVQQLSAWLKTSKITR